MSWILNSIIALVLYSLWAFFPKLAQKFLSDPFMVLVWQGIGTIAVALLGLPFYINKIKWEFSFPGITFAVLTGLTGMAGSFFFFQALAKGKTGVVTMITALYPILVMVYALVFLQESLSLKQYIGMAVAMAGVFLLST
jgi:transporter family protein